MVDADNISDEETDLVFGYENKGDETSKIKLIGDYLPEQDDYSAKTVLAEQHPEIMAAIENLTEMYPEVEHMEPILVNFIKRFEKRQISVHGRSREEFLDILTAMSGGSRSDLEERTKRMEQLLTPISQQGENDDS
jgi:hypothetical protein